MKGLTPLQKKVLDCAAAGMSTKEIADTCDCSESSVRHIRSNPELRIVWARVCNDSIEELLSITIKELGRIVSDPGVRVEAKIAAAKQILEFSRAKETTKPEQQNVTIKVEYV